MLMPFGRQPTASASLGTEIRVPQVAARARFTKCDVRTIRNICSVRQRLHARSCSHTMVLTGFQILLVVMESDGKVEGPLA